MGPIPDDPGKTMNEMENLSVGDNIMPPVLSSESDGEEIDEGGYQLLPQEPHTTTSDNHSASQGVGANNTASLGANRTPPQPTLLDNTIRHVLGQMEVPGSAASSMFDVAPGESGKFEETTEMWNARRVEGETMDQDHANKIREAMAGFNLPTTSQPDWAKRVSEDVWKARLFAKLHDDDSTQNMEDGKR